MEYTLKGYQEKALGELLTGLNHAKQYYSAIPDVSAPQAVSFTATTGAGKTVIASALIESLFFGNEDFDFETDETAVVLWFSSNPSLNAQSRDRIRSASDRLRGPDLIMLETTFDQPLLDAGKVYFLNHNKLSSTSRLVRGHDESQDQPLPLMGDPDARGTNFWDTLKNTIEHPQRTLYLFLDEAHEGMGEKKATKKDRQTIVKRLINGEGTTPAMPIVLGLTATPDRFLETAQTWGFRRQVVAQTSVDTGAVQESGLLKDQFALDFSPESGDFDTVLLRRATRCLMDMTERWQQYGEDQKLTTTVQPLMVLQIPNTPDRDDVADAISVIRSTYPELQASHFVNVFGEHKTEIFGPYSVPYLDPERVQEAQSVRVLIAKDAISTGWDCPRAEVLVSFRTANDPTYITQLLGRMVRTPLAHRVPGDDVLGTVFCFLPKYDKDATEEIVRRLENGGGDSGISEGTGRRVLINPQPHELEIKRNPEGRPVLDEGGNNILAPDVNDVLKVMATLPTQSVNRANIAPVKRLTRLAAELNRDAIIEDANAAAHEEMLGALNSLMSRWPEKLKKAKSDLAKVDITTVFVKYDPRSFEGSQKDDEATATPNRTIKSLEEADDRVIAHAFKHARGAFGSAVAKSYVKKLAEQDDSSVPMHERITRAEASVAALATLPGVKERFDAEADKVVDEWFNAYDSEIKLKDQARQEEYREVRHLARAPQTVDLIPPTNRSVPTATQVFDGDEDSEPEPIKTYKGHILTNEQGLYPEKFNSWEDHVLTTEIGRKNTVRWYRNPSQAKPESLGIVYTQGEKEKVLRPDFLFFSRESDGRISASIVDPHWHSAADSLPKLKGLAAYAAEHGAKYARIEAISQIDSKYRALDLKNAVVRDAITEAVGEAEDLYRSHHSQAYS